MEVGNLRSTVRDLIFYLYEDSLVPELFNLLGEEKAIEFIRIFGGMRIEIPAYKKVVDLQRNIEIYEALSCVNTVETVKMLAERFGITGVWVRQIYKTMRREYHKVEEFLERSKNPENLRITTIRNPRKDAKTDTEKCSGRDDKGI